MKIVFAVKCNMLQDDIKSFCYWRIYLHFRKAWLLKDKDAPQDKIPVKNIMGQAEQHAEGWLFVH